MISGAVNTFEPYAKRTTQGLILGSDGSKMSKSRGNVVDPMDVVNAYGADTLRTYVLFMGDYGASSPWSETSVRGCKRFLDRVARMADDLAPENEPSLEAKLHKTIKKVSSDLEEMKFNTAIAQMMTLVNEMSAQPTVTVKEMETLLLILSPVAPHLCEEIWQRLGHAEPIHHQPWPAWDEAALQKAEVEIAVQVNGKVRGRIMIPADLTKETAEQELPANPDVQRITAGKTIVKVIFVPGRLLNIVVK